MKRYLLGVVIAIALSACITIPEGGPLWKPIVTTDEFSDQTTKMVTVGEYRTSNVIWTRSLKYYPFVGVQNGEIYVGIRSGGVYRVPTGTVQIRVDNHPAWTITPEETPLSLAPAIPTVAVPNMPSEARAALENAQQQSATNVMKIMSPYTAATGDKARNILRQMVSGRTIKYRTIGINQAASTTGEVEIDTSFIKALRDIGISPENL